MVDSGWEAGDALCTLASLSIQNVSKCKDATAQSAREFDDDTNMICLNQTPITIMSEHNGSIT